ncbi:MAG TPA: hypothetical protein VGW77_07715 [Candidatus Binatia bacterium]|nr:hypothetical protein [Candidatus Binatia bacterium]
MKIERHPLSSIFNPRPSAFASQKIYRRMLTFMITPMAHIIDDEAKLRYPFHS